MIFFYLLITVMPLSRHPLWGRFVGDLTMIKYLGGACLLYGICRASSRALRPCLFSTPQARMFLVLVALAVTSFCTLEDRQYWQMNPVMSYLSFLLLFLVTLTVVDTERLLHNVLLASVASVAFASLYVIREWQKYHLVYTGFRPGWVVGDPNYFSISAVLCLPVAFCLIVAVKPRWERRLCLACLVLTLLAAMLAASRGGLLGMVIAFVFVVWHSYKRIRNITLAGVLVIPLSILSPATPLKRVLNPDRSDNEAVDARRTVWRVGLRMVAAHPLFGIGLSNFKREERGFAKYGEEPRHIAHNSYLEVAAELGLPALLAFGGVLICSFRTLGHVRRAANRQGLLFLRQAALGIHAGLLGAAVSIFFVSGQYQKLLWLMVFLSMCLPTLLTEACKSRS